MSNDKSLRDIWSATDKISLDVLRAAGGVPESCNASVITTASSREKCASYIANQTQESYLKRNFGKQPIPCGLFPQPNKENVDEDETMSLISSIWTPTIKDECVTKDYQRNPLLVVKIPGKDAQQKEDSNNTVSVDGSYEKLLEISSSESELSNNCGSDESQDELNDETFGESDSVKSEMTLSNLSEVTAKCVISKKNLQNKKREMKKSESTDSDHSENTVIDKNYTKSPVNEFNSRTSRANVQAKIKQNNGKTRGIKHRTRSHRNLNSKVPSSKFSPLGMESDEVLSVSRENLTFQESHSSHRSGGRMSNVQKNIAIETREVLGKKGRRQKITYVRGKIVEETNDPPNKNLKWNTNLCNLNIQNRNTGFPDKSFAFNRAPQTNLVEANSNWLYNSKNNKPNTFKHVKNGKLVIDDCLKVNGNFAGQGRRDNFMPPRKDFEILKKETKIDPLYEPRFKYENYHVNKPFSITNNTTPKCPAKITNREHVERKIKSASQNNRKFIEDDMRSEVSWNIVNPEEEIERKTTVKKTCIKEMPTQTVPKDLFEACQARVEAKQVKKSDHLPKSSQNDVQLNDHFVFHGNIWRVNKEEETEAIPKFIPKTNVEVSQVKRSDQLPRSSQGDVSYVQSNDQFSFHENIRRVKQEVGAETLPKFVPRPLTADSGNEFCATENLSFFRSAKLKEERAQKRSLMIADGREVADLIVGCHTALDVLSSFYYEWLELRNESINLLEKIMIAILKCGSKNEQIRNIIAGINIAADAANVVIPHRGITLGAKIAAVIGNFVANLFKNEFSEKDRNAKEFEVRQIFQKDIDTSSMVYIYGVQCSSQFEDTCRAIKSLHQRTQDSFDLFMTDESVIKFLKEVSEYSPSNVTVFYKTLRFEYQKLIRNSRSDESRAFTRVFEVVPKAIPVIDLLPWKFEPDGFDNSIVMNAWEELFSLFNDNGLSSNDEFLRKVQNCLFFLKKEKAILQRNIQSLLK